MWYNYHTSLWTYCSGSPKVFLLDLTYNFKNILLYNHDCSTDLIHFQALLPITHDETCDLAHLTKMDAIHTIMYDAIFFYTLSPFFFLVLEVI
jgi:midasin